MKELRLLLLLSLAILSNSLEGQYLLKMNFSQMDNYIGKRFEIRVTEIATGKEVGRKTIQAISGASFSFNLYVLLQGRSYDVDFYVDVNGSGGYEVPPSDQAWRRIINNATQTIIINFIPDNTYTDIQIPAEAFPYGQYDALWGGKWMNLTFGSTDTIEAQFQVVCDSLHIHFTTSGIFGNPAQVDFDFRTKIPDGNGTDTTFFNASPPWSGKAYVIHEELHGDLSLSPFELIFTGTIGAKQILSLYDVKMSGNPLANGYFYVRELEINSSAPLLTASFPLKVNPTCVGDEVELCVAGDGGVPPYEYLWSTGEISNCILVPAGFYIVTIVDALGCTVKDSAVLADPPPLIGIPTITDASCYGVCDGSVSFDVSGGTPPYLFANETGLCAGSYEVFIMDAAGCIAVNDITISSPDSLSIYGIVLTNEMNGQSNGSILVEALGGVFPYTYSLDGITFQSGSTFTGLPAGTYTVYLRDAHDCLLTVPEIMLQNITAVSELAASFRLYPNPVRSILRVESDEPLSVDLLTPTGRLIRQSAKSLNHELNVEDLPPGFYLARISDGNHQSYKKIILQ